MRLWQRYSETPAREIQAKDLERTEAIAEDLKAKATYTVDDPGLLQCHPYALVRSEKEAKTNIKEAALHRQMAASAEENGYSIR